MVSAITVRLAAGVDPLAVAETISGWPDVSVHTQAGQHELLVYGMICKARRQIGLFRALLIIIANDPGLILANEPTAALDSHRGRQVMELFRKVAHERVSAVIVVTHDQRSLDVFDRMHEMEDGRLKSRTKQPR